MGQDTASMNPPPCHRKPLTGPIRDLLRRPNPAVIATIGRNGQPVTAATWYVLDADDMIVFNIEDGRARIRHLAAEPRFALTALDDNWYTHLSIQGRIVETYQDSDLADIDRISLHYTGHPYPIRDKTRTSYRGVIESWFGWHIG
jgi:PPOX class probable F420-dependent enzyme